MSQHILTSDAGPSSFVPRFQRSGGSRLLFLASFRVPVRSTLLLSDSPRTGLIGFCLANWRCGSGLGSAESSIHSPNSPDGFSSCLILLCICMYGPSGWASVMAYSLPCSGRFMIYSKGPLTIPGRRYCLPGEVICLAPSFRRHAASKQLSKQLHLPKHPSNTSCE